MPPPCPQSEYIKYARLIISALEWSHLDTHDVWLPHFSCFESQVQPAKQISTLESWTSHRGCATSVPERRIIVTVGRRVLEPIAYHCILHSGSCFRPLLLISLVPHLFVEPFADPYIHSLPHVDSGSQ